MSPRYDVIVVGAGFGGLGAALRLSEQGARVLVLEALTYGGGCASTFGRAGHRFEAGATLFSGFGPGQLFRTWIDAHGLDVDVDRLDPVVEFRAPGLRLPVPPTRERLLAALLALPGAPADGLLRFFDLQARVADVLWNVLDDPALLPPFDAGALLRHARALPRYLPLARLMGRPLGSVLRDHGVHGFAPLRLLLDGLCQITVQCGLEEAEAPFALGAMDTCFRGTGHVRGGIGTLAAALVGAIRAAGGDVRFGHRVSHAARVGDVWHVTARGERLRAPVLVANLVPQSLRRLLGREPGDLPELDARARAVEDGWGACMLYRVLAPDAAFPPGPHHVEAVHDAAAPLIEGNHVFCSIGAPGEGTPGRGRTLTASTHVPMRAFTAMAEPERAEYVAWVQQRMRTTVAAMAPETARAVELELTASPRTFARFTGRHAGYVGGIPRRHGLHNYRHLAPRPVEGGLYLVGDSVFPGQSTLATALGGTKLADHLARGAARRERVPT